MKKIVHKKILFARTYLKCKENLDKALILLESYGHKICQSTGYNYLKDPLVKELIDKANQGYKKITKDEGLEILAEQARDFELSPKDRRDAIMNAFKAEGWIIDNLKVGGDKENPIQHVHEVSLEERKALLKGGHK